MSKHKPDVTASSPEAVRVAEAAMAYYRRVAFSNSAAIAHSRSPVYYNARRALTSAIALAWPKLRPTKVYDVWLDGDMGDLAPVIEYIEKNGYGR